MNSVYMESNQYWYEMSTLLLLLSSCNCNFEDTRIMLLRCLQPPSWCHYLCCCDLGGARFENCGGVEVEKNEGTGIQIILFSGLNYKYMFIFFKLVGPGLHQTYSTSFLSPLWKLMGCLIRHYLVLILDDDFRTENIR